MMKIKTLMVIVSLCAAASNIAAVPNPPGGNKFGLGAQFNFTTEEMSSFPGAALVISPSQIIHFTVNWHIGEKANIVGFTFDICPLSARIISLRDVSFNFTLGAGLFFDMEITREKGKHKKSAEDYIFGGGLRLPVGLSLMLGRNVFEIFANIAPSFGVNFVPTLEFSAPFFPIALGARFWFG